VNLRYQEGWTFLFFPPPPIYRKMGEELTTQLAQASKVASSRSNCLLEEHPGRPKWAWLLFAPLILLNTPLAFFCWFFFRNVTKTYELHNDTCFLSVILQNLTDYVFIPFFPSGMLRNFTDCAFTLPFNFWHVTELHGLCYNAFFWLPPCLGTSRIA